MTTVFPGPLFETRDANYPHVICALSEDALSARIKGDEQYLILPVPMIAGTMYLGLKGFRLRDQSDKKAKSSGSDAVYLASAGSGRRKFLLQYLRSGGVTSKHYHKQTTEAFHLLAGNAMVRTPGEVMLEFANRRTIVVSPPTQHQLMTRTQDSLILLEMNYDADNLGMSDHFPADLL